MDGPWQEVADGFSLSLVNMDGADGQRMTCRWSLVEQGVSGSFQLEAPADVEIVVSELALRVGDRAAEKWRAAAP